MSTDNFDPYYKWLGIAPHEQPPDHYRLLGVNRFESDLDVIEHAADARMAMLRARQAGAHAVHSQRLLSHVAVARACLLGGAGKQEYDQKLRGESHSSAGLTLDLRPAAPPRSAVLRRSTGKRPAIPREVQVFAGGIAGLAIGYVLICWMTGASLLDPFRNLREQNRVQVAAPAPQAAPNEPPDVKRAPAPPPRIEQPRVGQQSKKDAKLAMPPKPAAATAEAKTSGPSLATAAPTPSPSIFAKIGRVMRLPPLDSPEEVEIALLAQEPTSPLSLSLSADAAEVARGTIAIEPVIANQRWRVQHPESVLANMNREGQSLKFAWNATADPLVRRSLANCRLELAHADQSKSVQLRDPQSQDPLVLDMNKKRQVSTFAIPAPPQEGRISLRIRKLINFPSGAGFQKERLEARLGTAIAEPQVVIEFASLKGAEIGIRIFPQLTTKQAGDYAVSLEPVFKEGEAEYELTFERLEAVRIATEAALPRTIREVNELNADLAGAQRELTNVDSAKPAASDATAYGIWMRTRSAVVNLIDDLSKRAAAKRERVSELQGRSAAVPQLKSFLESLHEKAAIDFEIVAECGKHDIVLVDGTDGSEALPGAAGNATSPGAVDESLKSRGERAKEAAKALGLDEP